MVFLILLKEDSCDEEHNSIDCILNELRKTEGQTHNVRFSGCNTHWPLKHKVIVSN